MPAARVMFRLATAVMVMASLASSVSAASFCPPARVANHSLGFPGLIAAAVGAVVVASISSLGFGLLLGRWFATARISPGRAIPIVVLTSVTIVAVLSMTIGWRFAAKSASVPTAEEVAAVLQMILLPVALLATSATAWVATRIAVRR